MQIENTDIDKIKLHWNIAHEPFILILPPHTLQFFGIQKVNNMYFTLWPPCPYPNATHIYGYIGIYIGMVLLPPPSTDDKPCILDTVV